MHIQLTIPEDLSGLVVEAPTGYLREPFDRFYTIHLLGEDLVALDSGPGEIGTPIILSTASGHTAMGAYSPDLPQKNHPKDGYGRWSFPNANPDAATNKWNMVFRRGTTPAGVYDYHTFVVVGSLENVRVAMRQLHFKLAP
jgi:hypothetical protein